MTNSFQVGRLDWWILKLRQYLFSEKTNSPFLSGDSFAALADYYAYGPSGLEKIDTKFLGRARSIFVNSDQLERLLRENGEEIKARVLISGNGDTNWDRLPRFPDSVSLWLAQNCALEHPLVRTLPIGIENLRLGNRGLPRYYKSHRRRRIENKVFVPPMSDTNPVRPLAVKKALARPEVFLVELGYMRSVSYLNFVKRFRFVLCLEGNGYENHRIWETLYFGNFPVMLSTAWSRSLTYLSLPILLVESLSEVNLELLTDFSLRHQDFNPARAECLWIPFWKATIDSHTFPQQFSS